MKEVMGSGSGSSGSRAARWGLLCGAWLVAASAVAEAPAGRTMAEVLAAAGS